MSFTISNIVVVLHRCVYILFVLQNFPTKDFKCIITFVTLCIFDVLSHRGTPILSRFDHISLYSSKVGDMLFV